MPLSFGSLLGGLATLIGTSPNIIVSRVRGEITGEPFRMFDYLPVGAGLAVIGIVFLSVGWRLLPRERTSGSSQGPFETADYTTEARLPAGLDDGRQDGERPGGTRRGRRRGCSHRSRATASLRAGRPLDSV
jgi:di/tricarboxylate transporter